MTAWWVGAIIAGITKKRTVPRFLGHLLPALPNLLHDGRASEARLKGKRPLNETKATTVKTLAIPSTLEERIDQIFPTLTSEQIARIAAHGRKRQIQPGEILLDCGDH